MQIGIYVTCRVSRTIKVNSKKLNILISYDLYDKSINLLALDYELDYRRI